MIGLGVLKFHDTPILPQKNKTNCLCGKSPQSNFLYTGCTTVNGIKENDISQLVDPVERYTIWQMKVNEFHFMSV